MAPAAHAKNSPLRRAAGEVLLVGLEGASLNAVEAAWLKLIRPGGVILFRRNIEDAAQTHALLKVVTETVTGSADAPLLRATDVEGGMVDRLRDLVAPMPSALAVGQTGDRRLFAAHGRLIACEIRMLGFNATFAPVLDLRTASSASVMTSRAASSDPAEVVRYATHFLAGLAKEGVIGCGKHFPGLGSGQVDSHHSTPCIEKPFDLLWREDLWPYRQLAAQLAMVMISHARYPQTRSGSEPSSISHYWITAILKKKIGFRGLVLSDDMEMGGILSHTSLPDAVLGSLLAGTHLIEICRDPALVLEAYEALLAEAERSPSFARRLLSAAADGKALRQKLFYGARFPRRPQTGTVMKARVRIQRFADEIHRLGGEPHPSYPTLDENASSRIGHPTSGGRPQ